MNLIEELDPVLRPEIAQSWHRCRLAGLSPESPGHPSFFDVDDSSRLMSAAAPVLDELADALGDSPFSLLLADRDCRVAYRWSGDRRFLDEIDGYGVSVGVGMDEPSFGTNAMGTGMEACGPVVVNGPDHYLMPYRNYSCQGHPIRHLLTKRIEGVLTILTGEPVSHPLFHPLLRRATQDIQARIVEGSRATERRLFLAFQHATRHRSTPVAVLGGDVVMTNRACLDLLGSADPGVLRALLPEATRRAITARELDLGAAGRVAVSAEPIDDTPDGVVFRLAEATSVASASVAGSRTAGRSVLVAGEPGTGHTYTVREIVADASAVTVSASAAVGGSERDWANRLVGLASGQADVVVVDDVELLPERLCTVLQRVMASTRARIVLTSCAVGELPPHVARLVGRCTRRIELAPLRERLNELPVLLASMGRARFPHREWSLTTRATEALCAQPWEGNLAELAGLVDELATRPLAGRIDLGDLPERYRGSSRTARLGEMERAERTAIVVALRAACGNKLRAAQRLGISRTTLYRRIRELDVRDDEVPSTR